MQHLYQLGINAEIIQALRRGRRRYEGGRCDEPGYAVESDPHPDVPAYLQTWLMVGIVMLFVVTLGGLLGVVLFNTSTRGLFPKPGVNLALSWVVNMGRSLPFLVLMAAIIPFTSG